MSRANRYVHTRIAANDPWDHHHLATLVGGTFGQIPDRLLFLKKMILTSLSSIHFGEVNYVASKWYKSPDLLQIQNTFDDAVQLRIRRNNSSPNFPISMRFVTFDSSDEANAIGDKVDLGTLQTDIELVINPKGTKWVLIILLTPSPNRFVARTSFFNVSTILSIDIKENLSAMETRKDINISATLITSVMHIEHTRIDFDDCKIGAHYVQHLQIWNRSESTLLFRLVPTTLEAVNLQFEDVDGPILTGSVLRLSPFGSIQLRVIFRAEVKRISMNSRSSF